MLLLSPNNNAGLLVYFILFCTALIIHSSNGFVIKTPQIRNLPKSKIDENNDFSRITSCYAKDSSLNDDGSSEIKKKRKKKDSAWKNTSLFPIKTYTSDKPPVSSVKTSLSSSRTTTSPSSTSDLTTVQQQQLLAPAMLTSSLSSTTSTSSLSERVIDTVNLQLIAAAIGVGAGLWVSYFKIGIETIREFFYATPSTSTENPAISIPIFLIPAIGGTAVAILSSLGDGFAPGLKAEVKEIDEDSLSRLRPDGDNTNLVTEWLRYFRKSLAAMFTLGTGNSLGPEGPGVEIGVSISKLFMGQGLNNNNEATDIVLGNDLKDNDKNGDFLLLPEERIKNTIETIRRNRVLLACGAAAGVSSGFNAPLTGVFFALEVVQAALPSFYVPYTLPQQTQTDGVETSVEMKQEPLTARQENVSAILIATVLADLVSRNILGNELALVLTSTEIKTPLVELPLYLMLGICSGLVEVLFSQTAKSLKDVFNGNVGPPKVQESIQNLPPQVFPIFGGLLCGIIGIFFPQILFFGYDTLNNLLVNNNDLPTTYLLTLLFVKVFTTALSVSSGLVGGTLAPSLFFGGMTGASFHRFAEIMVDKAGSTLPSLSSASDTTNQVLEFTSLFHLELAGVPTYAMVGAASVLAALFRAPLTASLLLFEETKDYEVLLPLLVSAGVASLLSDVIEDSLEARKIKKDQEEEEKEIQTSLDDYVKTEEEKKRIKKAQE